jgi:hypothetical protein
MVKLASTQDNEKLVEVFHLLYTVQAPVEAGEQFFGLLAVIRIVLVVAVVVGQHSFNLRKDRLLKLVVGFLIGSVSVISEAIHSGIDLVAAIIAQHANVYVGFHELRTRKSGSDRFIDLHLVLSRKITVEDSHGLADRIETGIKGRFPRAGVMIHVEPCNAGDECQGCKGVCKDGI